MLTLVVFELGPPVPLLYTTNKSMSWDFKNDLNLKFDFYMVEFYDLL